MKIGCQIERDDKNRRNNILEMKLMIWGGILKVDSMPAAVTILSRGCSMNDSTTQRVKNTFWDFLSMQASDKMDN